MAKLTFHKKRGTTNKGGDYEILNIANISMQLVTDETITDFRISSNDDDFGAFDDIVVETEMENGTEIIYAMQLKHNDRGNLSLKQLTQAKGDFSVKKYFDSVQNLKIAETKFILYTNLKFNVAEDTKFYLEGENFPIIATKIKSTFGFEISHKADHCYKFSIIKDGSYVNSSKVVLYEQFFENFFLCADQENIYDLKRSVTDKFKTSFCGNDVECDQYVNFLNNWGLEDGRKEKLDKKCINKAIALNIFSSRIKPLSFNHNEIIEDTKIAKRNILREAIGAFDVTIFGNESYNEVKKLWDDAKSELKDLATVNKLNRKYQIVSTHIANIDQLDSLTLSKLLWLLGKCPLILTQDESVVKAIDLCIGEKFILIKNDFVNSLRNDISVFETLWDLKTKPFLYDQLNQNFTCSLQGKGEINLEHLIKVDEQIVSVLKADDLLEMLKGPCGFGVAQEKLPDPYVERCVLKNAIDFKLLDNVTEETVIILDCVPHKNDFKSILKNHTLINIHVEEGKTQILNILNRNDRKSQMEVSSLSTIVYLSEKRCKYEEFDAIYNELQNVKNLHQFRVREDGNLEWIRTKGDVSDIEKYKLSQYYSFRERDLGSSEFENSINLLVGDPGMGKSELMKSFKAKCFSEYFTVSVFPKDVYSFFKTTRNGNYVDAFRKFLFDEINKSLSKRDQVILNSLLKKNKIIYVWDALDELSDKHRDIVTDIILELSNDCVQWVTSRHHLKNTLQNKFNVLALNLNKFNEDEQIKYIQERLSDIIAEEEIQKIMDKIKSSFALVEHKDILGIPLQLFMLTELFRQDRERYSALLNNFFLLTDLYKYFIEEKMNILYREKLGIDVNTSSTESLIHYQKVKILEEYTNAALRLLFPDTICSKLAIQNRDIIQMTHASHSNIGLVTEMKDQIPRFLHNSFAEYLAALYFVTNLEHRAIQTKDLFDPKYNNVRFFFDLLLTEGSQTHIGILYRNYSFIKSCESEILTHKDCGGRSVLHLACSWGQRYPELNVKYVGDNYIVDDDGEFATVPDTKEYLETIDYLLEKCDISETDDIYKMTPADYACETKCRGAEMRTTMKEITLNVKSTEIDDIIKLLYYAAHYDYHYEFGFFSNELSIQVERDFVQQENNTTNGKSLSSAIVATIKNNAGMTLLYIAAKMGNVQIVDLLLKADADINAAKTDGSTPVFIASQDGNDETVEILLKAGADVNVAKEDGATPLFIASQKGNDKIVECLLKAGAGINLPLKDGATPLFIASQNGNDKTVELLLKAGVDVNVAKEDGATPLFIASQKGNDKIVECLLKAGAGINLPLNDGATPLFIASQNGCDNIVDLLLKAGAMIDLPLIDGATPFFIASQNGHDKVVELLLKAGASINLPLRDGATPLFIASQNGNDKTVELLLKAGADVDVAKEDGATPLFIASKKGNYKIIECLLKAGADINLPLKDGATPLFIASQNGNDKTVELLLKAGVDVNVAKEDGATPLFIASQKGNDKIVECLLKAGAGINLPLNDGATPLFIASQNGCDNIVDLLLKAGAMINLPLIDGATPFFIASQNGHDKVVELLLKAGASINLPLRDGATPLFIASQNGNDKTVELLLKAGADVDVAKEDGATPLFIASKKGNYKIIECLLKAGADINLPLKDGATPLFIASQNGNDKTVELLLKAGVDVNVAKEDGATPLFIASQKGNDKIVECLLKAGAGINLPLNDGATPLFIASQNGHDKVVELLLKAGASINLPLRDGATPLFIACQKGHDKIVQLLLKAGAAINTAMEDGVTPLFIASKKGNDKIIECLLKAGVDINLPLKDGATPLFIASQNGNDKTVELLLKAGVDVNVAKEDGATPLFIASQKGNDKIVECLLKAGAGINLPLIDGATPFFIACQKGDDKIVQLLLKAGAAINTAMKDGATPLFISSKKGNDKIIECLLKAGADINLPLKDGATPLFIASQNGNDKIVDLLLKAGANINLPLTDGAPPLFVASQNGNDETVKLLLKAGADVNVAKEDGATPLFIASQNGNDKIVDLLLKAGADVNLPMKDGAKN